MGKAAIVKKPVSYCYTPYFDGAGRTEFIEVWQVLEDEVLGVLYPWHPSLYTENTLNRGGGVMEKLLKLLMMPSCSAPM